MSIDVCWACKQYENKHGKLVLPEFRRGKGKKNAKAQTKASGKEQKRIKIEKKFKGKEKLLKPKKQKQVEFERFKLQREISKMRRECEAKGVKLTPRKRAIALDPVPRKKIQKKIHVIPKINIEQTIHFDREKKQLGTEITSLKEELGKSEEVTAELKREKEKLVEMKGLVEYDLRKCKRELGKVKDENRRLKSDFGTEIVRLMI